MGNPKASPTLTIVYRNACLRSGDKPNAITNYKLELQLMPNNEQLKSKIASLENGQ